MLDSELDFEAFAFPRNSDRWFSAEWGDPKDPLLLFSHTDLANYADKKAMNSFIFIVLEQCVLETFSNTYG